MSGPRITEKDAALIADAISGRSAEGRLEAGRRGMTEALRGAHQQKRTERETGILERFKGPSRATEPTPADKALAAVVAEREKYEAAKAQTERETAEALADLTGEDD